MTTATLKDELAGEVAAATSLEERLEIVYRRLGSEVTIATSLGAEDMVLLHASITVARGLGIEPPVFMLDTGRLHEATLVHLDRVRDRYRLEVRVYFPDRRAVEELLREKGPLSFLSSVEERKRCCQIRKLEPLARALASKSAWITGLRRQQSETRAAVQLVEDDPLSPGRLKINPLCDWSLEQVWEYLGRYRVPSHPLHDQGYPTIGCEPCTRAIEPGEELRAGRWWWESPEHKECGLHPGRPR